MCAGRIVHHERRLLLGQGRSDLGTVFISYSTKNAREAKKIRAALVRSGCESWMAPESISPGQDYTDAITEGLRACDRVLLLLSRHSNSSRYVRREIERAVSYDKPVIPVRLEEFDLKGGLEFLVSNAQAIDATATDHHLWIDDVVAAALAEAPLAPAMQSGKRGFFKVDHGVIGFCAAVAALLAVLIFSVVPSAGMGNSPILKGMGAWLASPLTLAIGTLIIGGFVAVGRRLPEFSGRQLVIRVGDVVATLGVVIAAILFAGLFLITPLVATALLAMTYIPMRPYFLARWRGLALAMLGAIVIGAWVLEGHFYRSVLSSGSTVAVVPNCGPRGCSEDGRELYEALILELNKVLQGSEVDILPSSSKSSYTAFFDRAPDFVNAKAQAQRMSVISSGRVFDSVAMLKLEPADCGEQKLHFTLEASPVVRGAPLWSNWVNDSPNSFGRRNRVRGFMPLDESEYTALLLAGLILRHVVDDGVSDPRLLDTYLNSVGELLETEFFNELPDDVRTDLASGIYLSATLDEKAELFVAAVDTLDRYASDKIDTETCQDSTVNAVTQFYLRHGGSETSDARDD